MTELTVMNRPFPLPSTRYILRYGMIVPVYFTMGYDSEGVNVYHYTYTSINIKGIAMSALVV